MCINYDRGFDFAKNQYSIQYAISPAEARVWLAQKVEGLTNALEATPFLEGVAAFYRAKYQALQGTARPRRGAPEITRRPISLMPDIIPAST